MTEISPAGRVGDVVPDDLAAEPLGEPAHLDRDTHVVAPVVVDCCTAAQVADW
jgi:hypothetical protein